MNDAAWERLLAAIRRIHEAGLAPETWPDALGAVARCLDSSRACLYGVVPARGTVEYFRGYNIDDHDSANYAAYYHKVDDWLNGMPASWVPGKPLHGTRIISDARFRRREHFVEFLKPQDIRFLLTGFPLKSPDNWDLMSVFRGVRQADFDAESARMYRIILEHAAQALEVQRTIGECNARARGLASVLEAVPRATLLLDRRRRVIYTNPAAEALLAAGDGLSVHDGMLQAAGAGRALDCLFERADTVPRSESTRARRVAAVPRPSGRRSYIVRVAPVAPPEDMVDRDRYSERVRFLVMISDPEVQQPVPAYGELRAVYGLTSAEAQLAAALARGATIAGVARQQNIAEDTARKRLKAVFEKTQTHRQAELVQRLLADFGGA